MTNQTDYKVNPLNKRIKLYLCTIYPGGKFTPEMDFNNNKLHAIPNLDLEVIIVQAGEFSHRHKRDVKDAKQCELRNMYLDKVPVGDWLLILDSDELIYGALDRIPDILDLMNTNDVDYAIMPEFLPDGTLKGRPRFIKKREGLSYGGEIQKHDWIDYNGENYIDIENHKDSWVLDFLGFFHYKNGVGMAIISNNEDTVGIPDNVIKIQDLDNPARTDYSLFRGEACKCGHKFHEDGECTYPTCGCGK